MSKRGQNEGSIYKRNDGRWCAVLNLGYVAGKRKRKSFYGQTRKEVQEQLTAALREQQQGLPVVVERQTVEQYLAHWLATSVKPPARSHNTYINYEKLARLYLIPHLGRLPRQKLAPQHVQAILATMQKDGGTRVMAVSATTAINARKVLSRALNQAMKWGLVAHNAAALADAPVSKHHEVSPFTPDEARAFLGAVKGHRQEALYMVALVVGLRQGEALGLRWDDIDLSARLLHVRKQAQRIDGKLALVDVKTPKSRRTIPLPQSAIAALKAHRAKQNEERLVAGQNWKDHGLVFPTTLGTPQDGNNVRVRFQRLVKQANLPRQRFHDLRHACISLLLAQNVYPVW